jgi:DNA-directed RNA polymerase specialized sigma24 family protein
MPVQRRLRLLAPYHPGLVSFARRSGAGADAEDIATDAVLYAALSERTRTDQPLPYLRRIVHNLVVDRFRDDACRQRVLCDAALLPSQRAVEDDVAARDLALRALSRLRQTQGPLTAWLVWRRAVDGLTWSELAAEVGLHPSKVQSRVWRAVQKLRPWLARQLSLPGKLAEPAHLADHEDLA